MGKQSAATRMAKRFRKISWKKFSFATGNIRESQKRGVNSKAVMEIVHCRCVSDGFLAKLEDYGVCQKFLSDFHSAKRMKQL